MGADLCGYLVKGPLLLDVSKREEAVAVGMEFVKVARLALRKKPDATALKVLEDLGLHLEFEVPDIAATRTKDMREMVDRLYALWDGTMFVRDMAARTDPDDPAQYLMFVGWPDGGDDGLAQETVKNAVKYGFLNVLGIR